MYNTEKVTIYNKEEKTLVLLDYYENDIWDLTEHKRFNELDQKKKGYIIYRNYVFDFTNWKNENLKREMKYYLQDLMHYKKRSLVSIVSYVNAMNVISDFLSTYNKSINSSFYYFDFDKTIAQYEKYLLDNGYKAYSNVNNILSESMEYRTYKTPTVYFRLLRYVMRFIQKLYKPKKENINLLELDVWDVRMLPFRVDSISLSRPRYTISFKHIKQKGINILAKKHALQRLKTKQLSTCLDDLKGINMFSKFLFEYYNHVDTLAELNRELIEDYLGFINLNDNLKPRTKSSRIGVLKTFFELCSTFGWMGSPEKTLIISQNVRKKHHILPKYYDDKVLLQINKHLEDLPIQIARMCYVIQNVGMRISELCVLETNCLKKDSEGDGVLVYYQKKTKTYNRIPVKEDIVATINEAINHTKETYGENSKYVFMKDNKATITVDMFSYHMNRLMKRNNVLDINGNIVRIKSHHFRSTVATKYANKGMKPNMIRTMLGQKSLGSLKHYVEIFDETLTDALEEVIKYQDMMIQNIGNDVKPAINEKNKEMGIPLPNGTCTKPISTGKCLTANACYTCAMFKPDPNNVSLFKQQLSEAESNLEMAKLNNFERLAQLNEELVDSLETIISNIE